MRSAGGLSGSETSAPEVAEAMSRIWWQSDIRTVLPTVQTPTLLMVGEGEEEHVAVAKTSPR